MQASAPAEGVSRWQIPSQYDNDEHMLSREEAYCAPVRIHYIFLTSPATILSLSRSMIRVVTCTLRHHPQTSMPVAPSCAFSLQRDPFGPLIKRTLFTAGLTPDNYVALHLIGDLSVCASRRAVPKKRPVCGQWQNCFSTQVFSMGRLGQFHSSLAKS